MAEQKDQKDQKKGTSESTKSPSTDLEKKMDKLSTQEGKKKKKNLIKFYLLFLKRFQTYSF